MRGLVKALVLIAGLVVITASATLVYTYALNRPPELLAYGGVVFTVEKGQALSSISDRLADGELIRSRMFLNLLSRAKGSQRSFQAGTYLIESGSTTLQIHDLLVSGRELLRKVTVPEGWTSSQIAERLEQSRLTDAQSFLQAVRSEKLRSRYGIQGDSLEGFLFPDTYMIPERYPAEKIVELMVSSFFAHLEEIHPEYPSMTKTALYEKIILASIIEREYRVADEAAMMASVFYNRLAIDMKLQSCATVAYVLTEQMGKAYPSSLTYRDLEVESEYNTYRIPGLPPGPISNPGATALRAVFFPARSEYLFFVLRDPDAGQHEFSRSYDEHNQAKYLYIKGS